MRNIDPSLHQSSDFLTGDDMHSGWRREDGESKVTHLLPNKEMKFKEIAKRLTGISTPIFGVSWQPPDSDREIAKRVVAFLEDQRLLLSGYESVVEKADYVVSSIYGIRKRLTEYIGELEPGHPLADSLRSMRSASRHCLTQVEQIPGWKLSSPYVDEEDRTSVKASFLAIGELRAAIGFHLALICSRYGLDLEQELAAILPVASGEDAESK